MSDQLKDKNRKPFEAAVYKERGTDGDKYFTTTCLDGTWFASDGTAFSEIAYPAGLPDSERMPDGKINAFNLERVSADELPKILDVLHAKRDEANRQIAHISEFVPETVETVETQ
jgi:hypothetical protein